MATKKNVPMTLCSKCGELTPAMLGVFEVLCPACLKVKLSEQEAKHLTLFKE